MVLSQPKLYKDRNLQIIFGVTLMAVLGVSSIIPAFPTIVEEFNISRTDVGMLIIAFTTPGVVLAPFIGILADRFGAGYSQCWIYRWENNSLIVSTAGSEGRSSCRDFRWGYEQ